MKNEFVSFESFWAFFNRSSKTAIVILGLVLATIGSSYGQVSKDSLYRINKQDTLILPKGSVLPHSSSKPQDSTYHSPRKAILRSAVLPGLGQVYNKKYWKLPIVYGILGACVYQIRAQHIPYKDAQTKLELQYSAGNYVRSNDEGVEVSIINFFPDENTETLRRKRTYYRRQRDFWGILTVGAWALQVMDAAVDAHLFNFDVSEEISLNLMPRPEYQACTAQWSIQAVSLRWKLQ